MPGISFDRAAHFYDATRGYTPGSAEQIRDGILERTGATTDTRFLELGVGTGRIALPFIQAGYDFTGVDISQAMMDQLQTKLAASPHQDLYRYELHQGDITSLPFADNTFDVIIAVHIFHLVDNWQQALDEARRVLRPQGVLVMGRDNPEGEGEDDQEIPTPVLVHRKWGEIQQELEIVRRKNRFNWHQNEMFVEYLRATGAESQDSMIATYERPSVSAREMSQRIVTRMYSSDWNTPDDVHAEGLRRLEHWLNHEAPFDPDEVVAIKGQFMAMIVRWPT
ncbi:MAG: class I SAM-dependent methyltransferase [Chloroflexota bacterium]